MTATSRSYSLLSSEPKASSMVLKNLILVFPSSSSTAPGAFGDTTTKSVFASSKSSLLGFWDAYVTFPSFARFFKSSMTMVGSILP